MVRNRQRNYREDVEIDPYNLENVVIEHPSLYQHYSNLYADAIEERDNAKNALELKYAQVEHNIRSNWDLHFEDKPTEPAIKSKILQDSGYKKAQKRIVTANKTVNVMKGVVNSFEHRKKAIEHAVSLHIGGFWSEPKQRKPVTKRLPQRKVTRRKKTN